MYGNAQFDLSASIHTPHHQLQHKNSKQWIEFFNDPTICDLDKSNQSTLYLDAITQNLNTDHVCYLNDTAQVKKHFDQHHLETCRQFKCYVEQRKNNYPRQYFPQVSHAFEFLFRVAPVKYVDGSWLYSALNNPFSHCNRDLIFTYLEELGLGDPLANHVSMYHDLIHQYELDVYCESLEDEYFDQAAVQMALAYAPSEYLPLVIGFNLGYEQLPLHLLITNYELAELGIDSQYFNVHITIDNAHNGHAFRAIRAYSENLVSSKNKTDFITQVKQGYLLNDIGKSSSTIISELNLDQWVLQIFKNKALVGQHIHNQKCQLQGQTINEWLSKPQQIQGFLDLLIEKAWIIKNKAVEESRFWKLIDQTDGKMFGVFNATEKQIIKDWIQGNSLPSRLTPVKVDRLQTKVLSPENHELIAILKTKLKKSETQILQLNHLRTALSPQNHHQSAGLWATKVYAQTLFPFQSRR